MNILITGGSGFIGRRVIEKMRGGQNRIMALSRSSSRFNQEFNDIEWLECSLELPSEMISRINDFQPNILIHLAWENIPDFSFETSFQNLQNQIIFFKKVFKIPSINKIIAAGSCFEYTQKFGECKETDVSISTNYFNWAKNSIHDFLQFECDLHALTFAWVRIFYVYGPNQRNGSLIPTIIKNIQDSKAPEIKKPLNANDFIYVDDVAEGLIKFAEENKLGSGIYNLGTAKSTSVIEVLRIVEKKILDSNIIFAGIKLKEYCDLKENDFWADMNKTRATLNWEPRISLEEGIEKIVNFL